MIDDDENALDDDDAIFHNFPLGDLTATLALSVFFTRTRNMTAFLSFCLFSLTIRSLSALQITTTASSKLNCFELQDFISRPVHWPEIVASSNSVSCSGGRLKQESMSLPLNPGMSVKEFFGLGLLSVEWTCRKSPKGTFLVESPEGIPGVAKDCSMNFEFENNQICLTMGYTPVSVLAILAMPILIIDNWIALNVLLPAAVDPNPLDSFRKLMGALYGVAGLAHFVDLVVGDSILFTQMGLPQFSQLPAAAQAYAVLWCAVGPLAFLACKQSSSRLIADGGLALYGAVEVLGAYLATSNTGVSEAFVNAVVVQGIVFAAWLYSSQKEAKTVEKAND